MSGIMRVLIADDQQIFAEGLKTIIGTRAPDIEVVGIARDGQEAVELARELRPDLILMDIRMPNLDGVEAVRTIRGEQPNLAIIVLTTFDDDDYVTEALKYGAMGYLLKDVSLEELIGTIRGVGSGTVVISPTVAGNLVRNLERAKKEGSTDRVSAPRWLDSLSRRERQILSLIARGCNNYDICSRLGISEQTVKNYVSSIYDKMGVHDRLLAMREAERFSTFLGDE